ncbi:uncharacterized protein F5147DRAFT_578618 [Suillus discolor]|uniref:Uncharacterized protein n=1 Tax=Suillus discolor TaxID=1912936 RepID=A0A9P7F5U7_9AGAM|nr:uncharacterized protein F5147DRAFT_578618 [Suillus discolor]KAG2106797.1 hypothetical protein F5147DRAFT_578618 [Suillus discolor]
MFLRFVAYFVLPSLAAQVPLGLSPDGKPSLELGTSTITQPYNSLDSDDSLDLSSWRLDEPPPANETGHFVFETVNSLLQHWPNTRYRNGHTMVPGVIPKGTLLYHGAVNNTIPTVPEWTATDPEHSILFCRGSPDAGCWHLTLAATRPLKILYFDGTSAANTIIGPLDTQDIIAWGELRPDWRFREGQRLIDLCKWGAEYSVDGYVRMEMDFEVMLCDFTAGLEIVSWSHLASIAEPVSTVPRIPNFISKSLWFSPSLLMYAGSWHNRYPGDTRITLDLAGIVSLYDTTLAPSLVGSRDGQERCDHNIQAISSGDIKAVRLSVSRSLERDQGDTSGIDWKTLFRVIVERYSERFELIDYLLNSENDSIVDPALRVHVQLRVMLTPYIFHSTVPPSASHDSSNSWATPVFQACGTAHTSSILSYVSSLNPSERLLLHAVQMTSREICRVVTKMWVSGVLAGLDIYLPRDSTPDAEQMALLMSSWRQELGALMTWLDWSVWVKCRPACGPEEMCYLPSWPINVPRGQRPHHPPYHGQYENSDIINTDNLPLRHRLFMQLASPQDDDWKEPKPKCIRRIAPYSF